MLAALLEHPGDLVLRDELRWRLWADDTFVDFDNNLNTAVASLRDALGDSAKAPRFIETLPRLGYRFVGTLRIPAASYKAFAWLEQAYLRRDTMLVFLAANPDLAPVRSDPRFASLTRRVGVPGALPAS